MLAETLAFPPLSASLSSLASAKFYKLQSTHILRKFLGVFDLPLTLLLVARKLVVINLWDLRAVFLAMSMHWSQFVWFRFLFILLSRFSYVNSFQALRPDRSKVKGSMLSSPASLEQTATVDDPKSR